MHTDVALQLHVTRHPFSFIGDADGKRLDAIKLKKKGTWKDRLLDYTHGDEQLRDQAMAGMRLAGEQVGIAFDYSCYIDRQPVDSQRMLLHTARRGVQEAYVSALSKRHFTMGAQGESASKRHTILRAAEEAGIDRAEAEAFYDSDELRDVVWRSYGDMPRLGISAIPLFVFNVPEIHLEGGPLRPHATGANPPIVNGSMTAELFINIFSQIWSAVATFRRSATLQGGSSPRQLAAAPTRRSSSPAAGSAASSSDDAAADLLVELVQRGGDVPSLLAVAAEPARKGELHNSLRSIGYDKMGDRLKVAAALAKEATFRASSGAAAALVGKRVTLQGLTSRPELNGKGGVCERFEPAKGRCVVHLDGTSGAGLLLRIESLSLEVVPPTSTTEGDDDDDLFFYGF